MGYWRFEAEGESVLDITQNNHHGQMVGNAKRVALALPQVVAPIPKQAWLSGVVRNEAGVLLPNAQVRLERNGMGKRWPPSEPQQTVPIR